MWRPSAALRLRIPKLLRTAASPPVHGPLPCCNGCVCGHHARCGPYRERRYVTIALGALPTTALPEARVIAGGTARSMVDSIASFAGRWHVVVDCLAVQDLQTLQQCVAGMATSGAWLVLSNYHRAPGEVVAALSHLLLVIQLALKSGTHRGMPWLASPQALGCVSTQHGSQQP